ncbi:unnamed protein product [Schistosoma margrebowiei]|uniref:Uncharacterized protein n=1 Tax=Schistosoma margrebowiei TaxID=48269 RepID=A0A183M159_9TREM|nr:unnamed protein product [Schistosoma margrebowiei]
MQSALNQLAISVRSYGMCFSPLKYKVLLQDWQGSNPVLTLHGEQIEVEKFVYLGSCISGGGCVSDEINARIVKARAAYANLGHLWRLRDVSLALKGRIYNASVRAVLLYACETWSLRVEDVGQPSVLDHCCLRSIADIQWQHHVSNAELNYNYFGINSVTSVISHYNLDRLPPGVFTCPSGFFACDTFDKINERRNSPLQWPYRICLPIRLWCDKVLNCPISGSDEQNCSSTPPMSFPHTKFQIENEYRMLNDVLNQFENTSLLEFVGYRKKTSEQPITMLLSAYVNTFWLSLILLILISIIFIITILLCVYKLLKRKREAGTVRVTEVKDYPTNSEICNDDTLKSSLNNNHYSENAFSDDQLNKEETCNDDFQNNNSSNGSGNNDYHKFLPSDVNYLNGYLNSMGNQEIAPLINVTEKQ